MGSRTDSRQNTPNYMDDVDRKAFAGLVNAVVIKCFGHPLNSPLSEPESKHLSTDIEESTGLVIGWRSVKNYAAFLLNPSPEKQENPSVASLDTLARYVLKAPITTEAERKKTEEHFPYWFRYREQAGLPAKSDLSNDHFLKTNWIAFLTILCLMVLIGGFLFIRLPADLKIQEDFHRTDDAYLVQRGWFVQAKNNQYWHRRAEQSACLTLFTLNGDNWPKAGETPRIQNLLLHKIPPDCFRMEVHFTDFVPSGNWQQAGLLLMEDTLFTKKSIRLSLSYNDFFGGYNQPGEILIQAIASNGIGDKNLEEFIHQPLFSLANDTDRRSARTNLKNSAFRLEKLGKKIRVLYAVSPVDNFSFKEITTYEFSINPKYIGLFALKGFVDTTAIQPVSVRYFQLDDQRCE